MRELDRLERLFNISLYGLVLLPFLMIALGGSVGPVLGATFALALPASWWVHKRRLGQAAHAKWWNAIALLFLAVTAAQVATTELTMLTAGIRFVLVLTLIKLFSRLGERDELQLFALSFLTLAAATTVNEDVTFGVLFSGYVLLGTFALAVFHLRSELAARPRLALRDTASSLNAAYFAVLMGMGALILSAALSIFFLFPRIGLGFFAPQTRDGVSVTGFSDAVELGGHGAIRDNPEVVMRVEFLDGRPATADGFHWRTLSFDKYDGKRWSRTLPERGRALPIDDGVSSLAALHHSSGPGERLQIYLEPIGKNVIPVVRPTDSVRLGVTKYVMRWGPRAGYLRRDWYDDIHHTIDSDVGIAYILTLAEGTAPAVQPDYVPSPAFRQLPPLSTRVQALAAQVTQGATTHRAKADAIVTHLSTSYGYTTDLPDVGADPLDSFLFETKRGHCEYFATASVMLLRQNGVPARLVNGFMGGQWNSVGEYLAVRQGDAHSWAEYWDPERGWTEIDATPASDALPSNSALEAARATWDALRLTWMKWVIEYDLSAQIEVFRKLANLLQPRGLMQEELVASDDPEEQKRNGDWRLALLIAGLATLMFVAFRRTRRRLHRHDAPWRTSFTAAFFVGAGIAWAGWFLVTETVNLLFGGGFVAFGALAALFEHTRAHVPSVAHTFEVVERAAARVGVVRRTDEGPDRYLTRLAVAQPHAKRDIELFQTHYLKARFGAASPDPEELSRLRASAHRIAENLRKN